MWNLVQRGREAETLQDLNPDKTECFGVQFSAQVFGNRFRESPRPRAKACPCVESGPSDWTLDPPVRFSGRIVVRFDGELV